jgi:hypothetical protein
MKTLMFIIGSLIFVSYIMGYMALINSANKSQEKEMSSGKLTSVKKNKKEKKIILDDLSLEHY